MCGILGIVTATDQTVSLSDSEVAEMRDQMRARGPDDATLLRRDHFVFAHRRLAIRDLAGGRQPIVSANQRYVVVYNGEIYNDGTLRRDLKQLGHRFTTRCDSEVLVAAWQEWQDGCIEKLRGMFSFAVFDLRTNQLTLVRDRFGIKPLFYATIDRDFVFASSIPAILKHPKFSAKPNLATVSHYLSTLRITLDDMTLFEGISTVRPAEKIQFADSKIDRTFYWQPPVADEQPQMTFEEAVDQLEKNLREAVSMRMVSDVPIGMMLSGGVDSNTLSSLIKDETHSSFHAVCGGGVDETFPVDNSDFEFAEKCATHNRLDFETLELDSGAYLDGWQNLVDQYQTPVSTPTDVIINRIAQNLKRSVGVAIGGEGADEACCGYQIPHWAGNDFDLLNSLDQIGADQSATAFTSLQSQYGDQFFGSAGDHYLACNGLIPREIQKTLFREQAWENAFADHAVEDYYDNLFASLGEMANVEKTAHVLLRTNLESLLSRLDSATMLASLESRVPYTDHVFVEDLFRLPRSYRIDIDPNEASPWRASLDLAGRGSLRSKRLIHSFAEKILPKNLAKRPKSSFATPVPTWLRSKWKNEIQVKIQQSEFLQNLFRGESLEQVSQLPDQLSMWNWPIANLAMWGDKVFN